MTAKAFKTLALITIIVTTLIIPITTVKQIPANTINSAAHNTYDTLYLRRFTYPKYNLTTAKPTETTAAEIIVSPSTGGRPNSIIRMWVNETEAPREGWIIPEGTYNFTFWIKRTHDNINIDVTFTFGYVNRTHEIRIATGTKTGITPPRGITHWFNITALGGYTTISSGSRLFIRVNITVSGPTGQEAIFYYDGTSQATRIMIPSVRIRGEEVPEFPFGVVFTVPAMLSAYFVLRKRLGKLEK